MGTASKRQGGDTTVAAYARLIRRMWLGQGRVSGVWSVKQAVTGTAPQFRGHQQHDVQEFLSYLLDGLHDGLRRPPPPGTPTPQEAAAAGVGSGGRGGGAEERGLGGRRLTLRQQEREAAAEWRSHLVRQSSLVSDLFHGQLRSSVRCLRCGWESVRFDPFVFLSLPLEGPDGRVASLTQALELFTSPEELPAEAGWRCPRCGPVAAVKKLDLWRLPPCLLVHLKRFKVTPWGNRRKITAPVSFPLATMDLSSFCASPRPLGAPSPAFDPDAAAAAAASAPGVDLRCEPVYDLYAVANHHGGYGGGHYTAHCLHHVTGSWYFFNDSSYARALPDDVSTREAYVLFYSRLRSNPHRSELRTHSNLVVQLEEAARRLEEAARAAERRAADAKDREAARAEAMAASRGRRRGERRRQGAAAASDTAWSDTASVGPVRSPSPAPSLRGHHAGPSLFQPGPVSGSPPAGLPPLASMRSAASAGAGRGTGRLRLLGAAAAARSRPPVCPDADTGLGAGGGGDGASPPFPDAAGSLTSAASAPVGSFGSAASSPPMSSGIASSALGPGRRRNQPRAGGQRLTAPAHEAARIASRSLPSLPDADGFPAAAAAAAAAAPVAPPPGPPPAQTPAPPPAPSPGPSPRPKPLAVPRDVPRGPALGPPRAPAPVPPAPVGPPRGAGRAWLPTDDDDDDADDENSVIDSGSAAAMSPLTGHRAHEARRRSRRRMEEQRVDEDDEDGEEDEDEKEGGGGGGRPEEDDEAVTGHVELRVELGRGHGLDDRGPQHHGHGSGGARGDAGGAGGSFRSERVSSRSRRRAAGSLDRSRGHGSSDHGQSTGVPGLAEFAALARGAGQERPPGRQPEAAGADGGGGCRAWGDPGGGMGGDAGHVGGGAMGDEDDEDLDDEMDDDGGGGGGDRDDDDDDAAAVDQERRMQLEAAEQDALSARAAANAAAAAAAAAIAAASRSRPQPPPAPLAAPRIETGSINPLCAAGSAAHFAAGSVPIPDLLPSFSAAARLSLQGPGIGLSPGRDDQRHGAPLRSSLWPRNLRLRMPSSPGATGGPMGASPLPPGRPGDLAAAAAALSVTTNPARGAQRRLRSGRSSARVRRPRRRLTGTARDAASGALPPSPHDTPPVQPFSFAEGRPSSGVVSVQRRRVSLQTGAAQRHAGDAGPAIWRGGAPERRPLPLPLPGPVAADPARRPEPAGGRAPPGPGPGGGDGGRLGDVWFTSVSPMLFKGPGSPEAGAQGRVW